GVEVVAGTVERVEHRHRVAGAPEGLVGGRVIGAGYPHSPAAGLPRVVLVLPGLAPGLARRRNRELAPQQLSGCRIERGDVVAYTGIAAGGADDDLVLDRQRRGGNAHLRLVGRHVGFPGDLAGLLVGRDNARRRAGARDDKIAPQRRAAVVVRFLLL